MSGKDSVNPNEGSFYYMSSCSVTTYNDTSNYETKKKVVVNNNGLKDSYYKKSVVEDNKEKIIKEKGNHKLSIMTDMSDMSDKQYRLPVIRPSNFWDDFFNPLARLAWTPWHMWSVPWEQSTISKAYWPVPWEQSTISKAYWPFLGHNCKCNKSNDSSIGQQACESNDETNNMNTINQCDTIVETSVQNENLDDANNITQENTQ